MRVSGRIFGLALAGLVLVQSGQAFSTDPAPPTKQVPAPAPPIDYPAPPRISPSPVTDVPPIYGPAPKAAAPTPPSKDGKVRKELRRKKQADSGNCLSKSTSVVGRPIIPLFTQGENSTREIRVSPRVGLSSCDAVLALPVDDDDAWDRRAVLLQGRATHLITLGAYDVALQSLDEADAIGATRNDILFNSGIGAGNAMLRAYALGKLGKKDAALSEIARGRTFRPHATAIDRGFDRIENHINYNVEGLLATSASKIKWNPDLMRGMLPLYIWRGDMEGASRIADDVSTINPKPIGGWTISGTQSPGKQLSEDIEMQLQRAYVWAALGNLEKSSAIIAGTQADIAEFIGKKPVATESRKPSKSELRDYDARLQEGRGIERLVERWQTAIQIRADAATMPGEQLFDRAEQADVASLIVGIDLLRQFRFTNPAEGDGIKAMLAKTDADIARDILKLDANDLRDILPDPEYLSQVPRFGTAGDGILFGRENGISQAKEKGSDIRTIRFGTTSGTGPMADELSLLAIAQYAQKEGKDSFILLARRSIKRTTTVSGYYTGGYSFDSGYESQARVILLDSSNLPPEWAGKAGRLIMVKQVLDEIKPRYDALEARKLADKAKQKG
jgi:hypothetical protein